MESEFDVLIIEDEQVVIDSARKILAPEGFTIDEALDAETALQKLKTNSYKLILTDLMLPKISGLELINLVKTKYGNIPVIMITGFATLENAIQSLKAGAFDFVPKPFALEELLGVVNRGINVVKLAASSKHHERLMKQPIEPTPVGNKLENCYFLGKHSWAKIDRDGSAIVGVGRDFLRTIAEIQSIDFPLVNEEISQGNICVRITAREQLVHTVWAPLSGKVIEINHEVSENVTLINKDPIYRRWLVRIIPTNLESELVNLSLR